MTEDFAQENFACIISPISHYVEGRAIASSLHRVWDSGTVQRSSGKTQEIIATLPLATQTFNLTKLFPPCFSHLLQMASLLLSQNSVRAVLGSFEDRRAVCCSNCHPFSLQVPTTLHHSQNTAASTSTPTSSRHEQCYLPKMWLVCIHHVPMVRRYSLIGLL